MWAHCREMRYACVKESAWVAAGGFVSAGMCVCVFGDSVIGVLSVWVCIV